MSKNEFEIVHADISYRDAPFPCQKTTLESSKEFTAIYREHSPVVLRMARRLGIPEAGLDDVCQDVFLTVYKRIGDFQARSSLRTWILGILYNVVLVHRRTAMRKNASARSVGQADPDSLPNRGDNPESRASQRQAIRLADIALNKIEESKRKVLLLAEFEELSLLEIAQSLDANINTVATRLRTARKEFANLADKQHAKKSWLLS